MNTVLGITSIGIICWVLGNPPTDNGDAAVWYRQASALLGGVPRDEWRDLVLLANGSTTVPTNEQRALLGYLSPARTLTLRACGESHCEFGVSSDTRFTELPQHGLHLTNLATLLRAEAVVRIHDGDSSGAARLLGGTYRIANHLTGDPSAYTSSMASGLLKQTDGLMEYAIGQGSIEADGASQLLLEIRRFNAEDPLEAETMFKSEITESIRIYEDLLANAGVEGVANVLDLYPESAGTAVRSLEAEELASLLADDSRQVLARGLAIIRSENRDAAITDINSLLEDRAAQILFPWLEGHLGAGIASRRAARMLEARATTLESIVNEGAQVKLNAAIWYRRAAQVMTELESRLSHAAIVAMVDDEDDKNVSPDRESAFLALKSAESLCEQAAEIEHCDFSILGPSTIVPHYLVPLVGLMDVLLVRARSALQNGELDLAARRVGICYSMQRALVTDGAVCSSAAAHDFWVATTDLAIELSARDDWNQDRWPPMAITATRAMADPFGYVRARRASSESLERALFYRHENLGARDHDRNQSAADDWLERREQARRTVGSMSDDQLLAGELLLNGSDPLELPPHQRPVESWLRGTWRDDVVRSRAPDAFHRLETLVPTPILSGLESRIRVAARDVRRVKSLMPDSARAGEQD